MAIAMTLASPCDTSHAGAPALSDAVVDPVGEDVLAVHAESEACHGDARVAPWRCSDPGVADRAARPGQPCASRLPRAARASIDARGAPTIANSAATKIPFSRMSPVMMRNAVIGRPPWRVARRAPTRPRPLNRFDDQVYAADRYLLARAGTPPSARGMNVPMVSPRALPVGAEDLRCLVHAHRPGEPHAAVGQEDRPRRRALEFVRDAADELGHDVFERDQPLDLSRRRRRPAPGECACLACSSSR